MDRRRTPDNIEIHLKSVAKPIPERSSLKSLKDQLSPNHFKCMHKSYWVAIESMAAVRKNSVFMKNMELPNCETYREIVNKLL